MYGHAPAGFSVGQIDCVAAAAMGSKDRDAPLSAVPAWLKRKGDETIFDVRQLIKDCLTWHSCVVKM